MIITRRHLSRRTFLRGTAALIALPFLDAMVPALGWATDAKPKPPTRLGFVYVPNGMVMSSWTPDKQGKDFAFTPILKPLEPFRDQTLILTRLMDYNANALGDGGGDHAGDAQLVHDVGDDTARMPQRPQPVNDAFWRARRFHQPDAFAGNLSGELLVGHGRPPRG